MSNFIDLKQSLPVPPDEEDVVSSTTSPDPLPGKQSSSSHGLVSVAPEVRCPEDLGVVDGGRVGGMNTGVIKSSPDPDSKRGVH